MTKLLHSQPVWKGLIAGVVVSWTIAPSPSVAQLTPDATLGTENSTVTPLNAQVDQINGGAVRGVNLFHSFREFNINRGRGAYFTNPAGIENILTRVIGTNASQILGTLGVSGSANLFLLNPNGIVFGPNARLDIAGSFVATTANAIQFGSVGNFSATNPEAPALLTVQPSAFLFNQLEAQSIVVQANRTVGVNRSEGLAVPDGQSLLLVGGNVRLDNGVLQALNGRIELAGLAGVGAIGLTTTGQLSLGQFTGALSDVDLTQNARIDARGNGGNIAITARNITLLGDSDLIRPAMIAGSRPFVGRPTDQAGDIVLTATGQVSLIKAFLVNGVPTREQGNAGSIRIRADSLRMQNANIEVATDGQGNAGRVVVDTNLVDIDGGLSAQGISNSVFQNAVSGATTGGIVIRTTTLKLDNAARLSSQTYAGNANDIFIQAGSVSLTNLSSINSSTNSRVGGRAGNITIAAGAISLADRSDISANTNGRGDAGNIQITGEALNLSGYSNITSNTNGVGNGGNVTLALQGDIAVDQSYITSAIDARGRGNGGNIQITGRSLSVTNREKIPVGIFSSLAGTGARGGRGTGGNITIDVGSGSVLLDGTEGGIDSSLFQGAQGRGGNVQVTAGAVTIRNNARIRGRTFGVVPGNADAGNITVNTGSLRLESGGQITATTAPGISRSLGQGNGGNITIHATGDVSLIDRRTTLNRATGRIGDGDDRAGIYSDVSRSIGQGGTIDLHARSLSVENGAVISSTTSSIGNAGRIRIQAIDSVRLSRETDVAGTQQAGETTIGNLYASGLLTDTTGSSTGGRGGDIEVSTPTLQLLNGSVISATTSTPNQDGGSVQLKVGVLSVSDGGQVITSTFNSGKAGNITIEGGEVLLSGSDVNFASRQALLIQQSPVRQQIREIGIPISANSGLFADTTSSATGSGGSIAINGTALSVSNAAQISAQSQGQGDAGSLTIAVERLSLDRQGRITTDTTQAGTGGEISVTATQIDASSGGQLRTTTSGSGAAGNIRVQVGDRLRLRNDGTGFLADTEFGSTGSGGSIFLDSSTLQLQDGAEIAVGSRGTGQGGNIQIQAGTLTLDRGFLSAETSSAQGGNIALQLRDLLLMRYNSQISTTAGTNQAGGNGGNITISAPFIVAVLIENSDIKANAFTGRGGRVNITAQGIYGIQFRPRLTPLSDITASSEFGVNGEVVLNTLNVDPSQGLVALPANLVDPSNQIAQGCAPRAGQSSSFVATGRGGLPPSPREAIGIRPIALDWVGSTERNSRPVVTAPLLDRIVEAQELRKDANGNIALVAATVAPYSFRNYAACDFLKDPSPNLSPTRRGELLAPPSLAGKGVEGLSF